MGAMLKIFSERAENAECTSRAASLQVCFLCHEAVRVNAPLAASFNMAPAASATDSLAEAETGEEAGLLTTSAEALPQGLAQRLTARRLAASAAVWDRGFACILLSAAFFAVAASLVKTIGQEVTVFQVIVIRSGLSMAASYVAGRASGISPLYGQTRHWPLLGRYHLSVHTRSPAVKV